MKEIYNSTIAVIGLGYVGLPLAVEFGKHFQTVGFDINAQRVSELKEGIDHTLECSSGELKEAEKLTFHHNVDDLNPCNVFIVTVPTPIDEFKRPDLTPILSASKMLASVIKKGDVIIYESTVYPGATEEDCVPILEELSGLKFNVDFFVGYSPERINPGDKTHRLPSIKKVTSGSTDEAAQFIDDLYSQIITAGTYKAPSIKVAEAAKVIENTQRDLNIALVNELAIIFNKLEIDTEDVLKAAGTKWNFLPFRPGLVGGHCIGVDPYYLTHKAQSIGYHPEVILAGRRINDDMGSYICSQLVKFMLNADIHVKGSHVLIMGLTFKENCPDIRNTKVMDIYHELQAYNMNVDVYDPLVDKTQAEEHYGVSLIQEPEYREYDAIIVAVPHQTFLDNELMHISDYKKETCIIYDLKYALPKGHSDVRV